VQDEVLIAALDAAVALGVKPIALNRSPHGAVEDDDPVPYEIQIALATHV
jgi:hypothetical protein